MYKVISPIIGLFLITESFSAIITYNNRDVWESLLTENTVIDFEGIVDSEYQPYPGNPQHVEFSSDLPVYVIDETFYDVDYFTVGTGDVLFGYNSGNGITASNFSATAIGMDLRGYIESVTTFQLTLSSGEVALTTVDNSQGGFIGITSDDLITSVRVTTSTVASEYVIIDNFSFGTASTVPEPGIFSLMVCSLICIPFIIRKKLNC